jgi:N-acetylglucosaminyl-diphospho-decaprenol L-rhamnosyltransferase
MPSSPPLHVVIVTYNSADDIRLSVESVARSATPTTVTVVDNASTDSTVPVLRDLEREGFVDRVVAMQENLGFAKAVNHAMRLVDRGDVLLFNPDATLDENALEILVAARGDLRTPGILSPLVYSGPHVRTVTAGRQPRLWPMFTHYSGLAAKLRRFPHFRGRYLYLNDVSSDPVEVEWVAGCSMYITREAVDAVGDLSERWFMYAEDVDYCRRVQLAGFATWLVPEARCFHAMGASVIQSTSIRTWWPQNLTDYYLTSFKPSPVTFAAWRVVFSAGLASRSVVFKLRSIRSNDPRQAFEAKRFLHFARSVWTGKHV